MLADHAVHFTCHVLRNVDLAIFVARDDHRDLWVQGKAEDLCLMEQLFAPMAERLYLCDALLGKRGPDSDGLVR